MASTLLKGDKRSVGAVEGAVTAVGLAVVERLGPSVVAEEFNAAAEGLAHRHNHGVIPGAEDGEAGRHRACVGVEAIGVDGLRIRAASAREGVGVLVGVGGYDRGGVDIGIDCQSQAN